MAVLVSSVKDLHCELQCFSKNLRSAVWVRNDIAFEINRRNFAFLSPFHCFL